MLHPRILIFPSGSYSKGGGTGIPQGGHKARLNIFLEKEKRSAYDVYKGDMNIRGIQLYLIGILPTLPSRAFVKEHGKSLGPEAKRIRSDFWHRRGVAMHLMEAAIGWEDCSSLGCDLGGWHSRKCILSGGREEF